MASSHGFMSNQQNAQSKANVVKILVIGDHNTGKTSIVGRYIYKKFDEFSVQATIGMEIAGKHVRVNKELLQIKLWDIAGQDRFIGLAGIYYRQAVAAIVVFDITDKTSLKNAKNWKIDVDEKVCLTNGDLIPVVLFANKWDLVEENPKKRQITEKELEQFCHENNFLGWFSTSAKNGMNIKQGMNYVIAKVIENKQRLDIKNQNEYINNENNKSIDLTNINKPNGNKTNSCCAISSKSY